MKLKNITDEATRKGFGQELALDANGVLDNLVDSVLDGLVDQVPEHEAGEVCVKPLVPRNQLVVEVEDGHPASLFRCDSISTFDHVCQSVSHTHFIKI